jgi:hypothetical protein
VPVRLLDEAIDHAEAKAGALAFRLGGEERLEHMLHDVWRDAAAGVADGEHHILPGLHIRVL